MLDAETAARPAVAAFLAATPGLAGRVFVDPGAGVPARGYHGAPFGLPALLAAAATDDPVGNLVRSRPDGEDLLADLACRRAGVRFLALEPDAPLAETPRYRAHATTAIRAARFRLETGVTEVLAPPAGATGAAFVEFARAATGRPAAVTTARRMERTLRAAVAPATIAAVTGHLRGVAPLLSAADLPSPTQAATVAAAAVALPVGILAVDPLLALPSIVVTVVAFLVIGWIRLLAGVEYRRRIPPPPLSQAELPAYTVLAALHREETMVAALVAALADLDYPADRLEVLLAIEADDDATLAAAERAVAGRPRFRVIAVPPGAPRTKPRALSYALAFARGDLVTVYDAEDRPDPDQLRKAAAAFLAGPDSLACVQARLVIERARHFLQRQFAVEYHALFDGLLPWLAAARLPLPLGGTSNHFKRIALDACGGWDPYNVTEDADLGVRLARFGYHTDLLDSATREQAPASLRVWLPQRTRWMKGWITTWLVAMRRPRAFVRETGFAGLFTVLYLFAATILSALMHPLGLALVILHATGLRPLPVSEGWAGDFLVAAMAIGLACGYFGSAFLAARTLRDRGRPELLRDLWLMPVYWLLISLAAWLALVDLIRRPHHWAKTPHRLDEAAPIEDGEVAEEEAEWSG